MLKRLILFSVALLALWLIACQSPTPETTPTLPEPTATLKVEPTAEPTVVQDSPTPTSEVVETKPAPTPTIPWQIPEIQPDDHVRGGEKAGLILVEYADFQ